MLNSFSSAFGQARHTPTETVVSYVLSVEHLMFSQKVPQSRLDADKTVSVVMTLSNPSTFTSTSTSTDIGIVESGCIVVLAPS